MLELKEFFSTDLSRIVLMAVVAFGLIVASRVIKKAIGMVVLSAVTLAIVIYLTT